MLTPHCWPASICRAGPSPEIPNNDIYFSFRTKQDGNTVCGRELSIENMRWYIDCLRVSGQPRPITFLIRNLKSIQVQLALDNIFQLLLPEKNFSLSVNGAPFCKNIGSSNCCISSSRVGTYNSWSFTDDPERASRYRYGASTNFCTLTSVF